jgi:hypothetical protein
MLDVVGDNCITVEDGEKLHKMILPALKSGDIVELDFSGVSVFASPFFNASIGALLKDISANDLNAQLKFNQLSPTGRAILRRVIENAKDYYSKKEVRDAG